VARGKFILDCGDDAGAAQGALRAGIDAIVINGHVNIAERPAEIAQRPGGNLLTIRPQSLLDLGELFSASSDTLRKRCADALALV